MGPRDPACVPEKSPEGSLVVGNELPRREGASRVETSSFICRIVSFTHSLTQPRWFHIRGVCIAPGCVYRSSSAKWGMGISVIMLRGWRRIIGYGSQTTVRAFGCGV